MPDLVGASGSGSRVASVAELSGVMGCRASLTVVADDPVLRELLLVAAEQRMRELEQRWTRFSPDSELSRLNAARGSAIVVSACTRALVGHLVEAWDATDGAFDPTLLPALVGRGYRNSVLDPARTTEVPNGARARIALDDVDVDDLRRTVRLPRDATIDAGGLGKGLAADLVVAELLDRGAEGAMVEIGGDLRVAGRPPSGEVWRVSVEAPSTAMATGPIAVVELVEGGVATSSRAFRRWRTDEGAEAHHLIDPRTRAPADRGVLAVTAVTGTAAWSEAFAKVPFVRDEPDALALLERESVAALVVRDDGRASTTSAWSTVSAHAVAAP